MNEYQKLKNKIIRELFKNEEYAEFLCRQNLADISIIDMICAAPISLIRKAEMLESLSKFQSSNVEKDFSYKTYYDEIQKGLDELKLKDDEIFLCTENKCENGEIKRIFSFPSRNLEELCSIVKQETDKGENRSEYGDDLYILEKWRPSANGGGAASVFYYFRNMIQSYKYTFINGEICYFDSFWERIDNNAGCKRKEKTSLVCAENSLNLPTPWKVGDILEIDATPFAPKTKVVVIGDLDHFDCCFPSCLYLTKKGVNAGALKHSSIYNIYVFENISPLFSVKKFTGTLSDKESILKEVSDYVKGNNKRGEKIFEMVTRKEGNGDTDYDALRKLMLRK